MGGGSGGERGGGGGLRAFWFLVFPDGFGFMLGRRSETLGREKGTADSDCLSSVIRRIGFEP